MNGMHNFKVQKQNAINQIHEMKTRATPSEETYVTDKKVAKTDPKPPLSPAKSAIFSMSDDTIIILGLILILSNDNTDMLLLLALVYILT